MTAQAKASGASGQEVSEASEVVQTGTETVVASHAGDQTASAGAYSSPSAPVPGVQPRCGDHHRFRGHERDGGQPRLGGSYAVHL